MNPFTSYYPSVAGTELPLASHHSSLVAVGSLHLPRQVLDLCLQLGLLVLKLYRWGSENKWKFRQLPQNG